MYRLQSYLIPEKKILAVNQVSATTKTPGKLINLKILQFLVVNGNYYPKSQQPD